MDEFKRQCPSCKENITYSSRRSFYRAQKRNGKCFNCSRHKFIGKLTEDFIKECRNVHGNLYDYSEISYKNNNEKIKIICYKHGPFWQRPRSHLNQKSGCPFCSHDGLGKLLSKTTEEFIEKSKTVHGDKYDYSHSIYINGCHKVKIICPDHGCFFQIARVHTKGSGCPKCKISKGELFIMKTLKILGKSYNYQHFLCKSPLGGNMKADFFLPNENVIVEFDGVQHFKSGGYIRKHFFTDKEVNDIQLRDKFKDEYCKNNGIKIIRIPYWDFHRIDKILEKI